MSYALKGGKRIWRLPVLDFEEFIPAEMAIAPPHPLAKNLELTTTKIQSAQGRIPGVVKRLIPLDTTTFWEYWWCVPDGVLLPEDVELLQSDRPRVEAILAKLIWLWGGHCFGEETSPQPDCAVYDYQQVLEFANQQGLKPDVLDIDFLPNAIALHNQDSVIVEPAHWHIEFFQLEPATDGFVLQQPKPLCSCQIWTGKPFTKHLETGETSTRYDLWVSRPLDMTNPPWRSPASNERNF